MITRRSYQAHSVADLGKFLPKAFKLAETARNCDVDVPYDLWVTKADADVPEPSEHSSISMAHRLAGGCRPRARPAARRAPSADPAGGGWCCRKPAVSWPRSPST